MQLLLQVIENHLVFVLGDHRNWTPVSKRIGSVSNTLIRRIESLHRCQPHSLSKTLSKTLCRSERERTTTHSSWGGRTRCLQPISICPDVPNSAATKRVFKMVRDRPVCCKRFRGIPRKLPSLSCCLPKPESPQHDQYLHRRAGCFGHPLGAVLPDLGHWSVGQRSMDLRGDRVWYLRLFRALFDLRVRVDDGADRHQPLLPCGETPPVQENLHQEILPPRYRRDLGGDRVSCAPTRSRGPWGVPLPRQFWRLWLVLSIVRDERRVQLSPSESLLRDSQRRHHRLLRESLPRDPSAQCEHAKKRRATRHLWGGNPHHQDVSGARLGLRVVLDPVLHHRAALPDNLEQHAPRSVFRCVVPARPQLGHQPVHLWRHEYRVSRWVHCDPVSPWSEITW